jgi:hypothetical protein
VYDGAIPHRCSEDILALTENDHPAEAIGTALIRANSILSAISTNFVDHSGQFAVNEPFVAQAVRAVEGLLVQATTELDRLYDEVDLRWKGDVVPEVLPVTPSFMRQAGNDSDLPAKTYDELLRKLTAAEVFAADLSESENDLLPLLNSIKEDLKRTRKAG